MEGHGHGGGWRVAAAAVSVSGRCKITNSTCTFVHLQRRNWSAYNNYSVSGDQACPAPPTCSLCRPSSSCTPCRSRPWPRACRRRNHSHRAGSSAAAWACRPRTAGTARGPRGCPPTRMSRCGGRNSPDACGTSSPCASRTCGLRLLVAPRRCAGVGVAADPLSPGLASRLDLVATRRRDVQATMRARAGARRRTSLAVLWAQRGGHP